MLNELYGNSINSGHASAMRRDVYNNAVDSRSLAFCQLRRMVSPSRALKKQAGDVAHE
jgi:hypothetical protein